MSASALVLLLLAAPPRPAPPPVVSLVELEVASPGAGGEWEHKKIRVAHPAGWTGDYEADRRSIRLFGPEGEGEILIAAAVRPDELGLYLSELARRHPASTPSPPQSVDVQGVKPERGERATKFTITGKEVGEMVMIERAGVIVLFSTVVQPNAWEAVGRDMKRCYPTVQVVSADPPSAPRR